MRKLLLVFICLLVAGNVIAQEQDSIVLPPVFKNANNPYEFAIWLGKHVKYPKKLRRANISGEVNVSFVIDTLGKLTDIRILSSPDTLLSAEVIKAIGKSPRWHSPAYFNGKAAAFTLSIPVAFGDNAPIINSEQADSAITMPTFRGGNLNDFLIWVQQHLTYPLDAMESGIQGTVVVSFIVESDGTVSNIEILQSPNKLLSRAVIEAIEGSPLWKPAMRQGEPISFKCNMPIVFRISSNAPTTSPLRPRNQ